MSNLLTSVTDNLSPANRYDNIINLFTSQLSFTDEFQIQDVIFKKLSGDASHKCFYRVTTPESSFILITLPTQGLASQEIFSSTYQLPFSPAQNFIEVAITLEQHLTNVSPVFAADMDKGIVLLSDHGDMILEKLINAHSLTSEQYDRYFQSLFSWILQLQNLHITPEFIGLKRQFCKEAIHLELKEFFDYALCQHHQLELNIEDKTQILNALQSLAEEIAKLPQTLIHRDLQSKNVMVENNKIWIIDYQDICVGPYLYDVASIIFDPYLNFSLTQQLALAKYYWQTLLSTPLSSDKHELSDFNYFFQDLTLIGIQRMLKCAGRFAYLYYKKGRHSHMQYVEPAINKAIELLQYHPHFQCIKKYLGTATH